MYFPTETRDIPRYTPASVYSFFKRVEGNSSFLPVSVLVNRTGFLKVLLKRIFSIRVLSKVLPNKDFLLISRLYTDTFLFLEAIPIDFLAASLCL